MDDYSGASLIKKSSIVDETIKQISSILSELHSGNNETQASLKLEQTISGIAQEDMTQTLIKILGPLSHALSKLLQSHDKIVQIYAARTMKPLILNDSLRLPFANTGIMRIIIQKLNEPTTESEVVKELLSNTQNFLYFENTSPAYASLNGLRDLSNWLEKPSLSSVEEGNNVVNSPLKRSFSDAECQGAALLCVLNALSHCDSVLNGYSHQMRSWMEVLIRTCQTANGGNNLTSLSLEMSTCALANALRDPGLLHAVRSMNGVEVLDRVRHSTDPKTSRAAEIGIVRLNGNVTNELFKVEPFRFLSGGNRKLNAFDANQILGLIAILLVSTLFFSLVALALLHIHNRYAS